MILHTYKNKFYSLFLLIHILIMKNNYIHPPFLSCSSWSIFNGTTKEFLFGSAEHQRREIASLTKLMTAYTALQIVKKYELDIYEQNIDVDNQSVGLRGISANLSEDDTLCLYDLLHGVLIPSGNDASHCVASFLGEILETSGKKLQSQDRSPIQYFISEMNLNATKLNMKSTNYANTTGLANPYNKSTAYDIGLLALSAIRDPIIKDIVRKKEYTCVAFDFLGDENFIDGIQQINY